MPSMLSTVFQQGFELYERFFIKLARLLLGGSAKAAEEHTNSQIYKS